MSDENILKLGKSIFQQFPENLSDVFWIMNAKGKRIYVSPAFYKIFESTEDAFNGNPALWFDAVVLQDRETVKRFYAKLIRNKENLSIGYKIIRKDGTTRDIYDRGFPVIADNGKLSHIIGIATDVTERKQINNRFETQYILSQLLSDFSSLEEVAPKVLRLLSESFGWIFSALWIVNHATQELYCVATWKSPDVGIKHLEFHQEAIPIIGFELALRVLQEKHAVCIDDLKTEKIFPIEIVHHTKNALQSVYGFPIISEGEVLGVIEFFSDRINFLDEDLFKMLSSMGAQLGVFTRKKHTETELEHMAYHDMLTGLANRSTLFENIRTSLKLAKEKKLKVAILFLDLDRFKLINDTHGHEMGDAFLKVVGERLRARVRKPDFIARLGGDEFVIVISDIAKVETISIIANKILKALSIPFLVKGHEFFITTSIGISLFPDDGVDAETLLSKADVAMYQAKSLGGNVFQFCTPEMIKIVQEKSILEAKMKKALKDEEFLLLYQPKYDLHLEKIFGVEALLYWKQNDKILSPKEFLPLAEETGLIIPIGEWVLRTACTQVKSWQKLGIPLSVSVNLSSRQLIVGDLLDSIMRTLKIIDLAPENLELEITEAILMKNTEGSITLIHALKNMGVQVSIDDFGTGYSSLMYLKRFKVNRLKIDQSFVHGLSDNIGDMSVAKAIIALSHSLGIKVIAEGVETKKQLSFLRHFDCDEMQGFYLSKPLTADKLTIFLQSPPPKI